jgi:hypothetical protein
MDSINALGYNPNYAAPAPQAKPAFGHVYFIRDSLGDKFVSGGLARKVFDTLESYGSVLYPDPIPKFLDSVESVLERTMRDGRIDSKNAPTIGHMIFSGTEGTTRHDIV